MIDFTKIRGDGVESQRQHFEQLVCHLAKLEQKDGEFRRIEGSGGDGGVEALCLLPTGKKIGYQAKYYPHRDDIKWSNLDKSVDTALANHPELETYVVALPSDFTGKRAARGGSTEGVWGIWDDRVIRWQALAESKKMKVNFIPWTAFEIEAALLKSDSQNLVQFFFNTLIFTKPWLQRQLNRTIDDLQARYSPDEHVNTRSLMPFDVIYKKENVRQDLREIFKIARASNPRKAATLFDDIKIPEEDILATEELQKEFFDLSEATEAEKWQTHRPWPVCRWMSTWYFFTRQLSNINRVILDHTLEDRRRDEDYSDSLMRQLEEATRSFELGRPEVFAGPWAYMLPIDTGRAALFVGRAGAGKSHTLARGAENALKDGSPVLFILGQHITDDDPRISILKRLEISDWSFHEALSALNLAAEAAGTRAMLVIDALNEGSGIKVWQNHIASFIREVHEHDRIVLVISCREEYLDYVIPSKVIAELRPYPDDQGRDPENCAPAGKLVRVSVDGFMYGQERENALQQFFDKKGIARPTAPVLDAEFFNPLFMTSVCRSMARAGIKIFPRGLHGAREIFRFVLEMKAKALGTSHDRSPHLHKTLLRSLHDLAGIMIEEKKEHVSLQKASETIELAFSILKIPDRSWLEILEGSDILRRDVDTTQKDTGPWAMPNEVVSFSFQRLQDNLLAEHLLNKCDDIDIERVFEPDMPCAFLLKRIVEKGGTPLIKPNKMWVGCLGAFWAAVSEKYNKELWDLKSFFLNPDTHYYARDFQKVFHISLRERSLRAFTQSTRDILNKLYGGDHEELLLIILSMSCIPDHSWNIDFLSERLIKAPPSERNTLWSECFKNNYSKLVTQALEIVDWATNVNTTEADNEVLRLASITLVWLSIVQNQEIQARCTKGFTNLVAGVPTLLHELRKIFCDANDPNILNFIDNKI